jgi:hypothetical protein
MNVLLSNGEMLTWMEKGCGNVLDLENKTTIRGCRTQIGMFRPIRMDHTNCLQVAIKSIQLDAKTGLLTGLLAGKQGWKCPVALLMTCCGSKSLKVILIDSDFRAYPVLNPLVTI